MSNKHHLQLPLRSRASSALAQNAFTSSGSLFEFPFFPFEAVLANTLNACASADPAQRYYSQPLNVDFLQFLISLSNGFPGAQLLGYGGNYGFPTPIAGSRLLAVDPYSHMAQLTRQQVHQIHWILLHSYPSISAAQLFANAGVSQGDPPVLTEGDAFAATQLAIWGVPFDNNDFTVQDCLTNLLHTKSARIAQVATYLLANARALGNEPSPPPAICIHTTSVTLGLLGGVEVIGPYAVLSEEPQMVALALISNLPFATLVDAMGTPISTIVTGASFYVRVPMDACCFPGTYTIHAGLQGTRNTPVTFIALDANNQPLPGTQPLVAVHQLPDQWLAEDETTGVLLPCGGMDGDFIPCGSVAGDFAAGGCTAGTAFGNGCGNGCGSVLGSSGCSCATGCTAGCGCGRACSF